MILNKPPTRSYRRIDYRLRPAKSIERKMLAEAFRRLSEFGRVDTYRYVGMGSIYFSDFVLFHRALDLQQMVSIEDEEDPSVQERFKFNLPFSEKSLDLRFGKAGAVLSQLNWGVRSIIWLDYEKNLNSEYLQDIALVSSKATPGSVLIVSLNVRASKPADETNEGKMNLVDQLKAAVGKEKVPALTNKDLAGWGRAEVYRTIIQNEIEETLKNRNGVLPAGAKMLYQQLFNFRYEDGARMLTVGGLLYDEGQDALLERCAFNQLDFYRPASEAHEIRAPRLTFREIRALNGHLPGDLVNCKTPVPPEDIEKYSEVYRYFPYFTESEI